MHSIRSLIPFAAIALAATAASAQLVVPSAMTSFEHIADDDSTEVVSTITVIQPVELEARIYSYKVNGEAERDSTAEAAAEGVTTESRQGFRVQVLSDSNQRTAQNEARSKEKLINERFPEYETYIVYNSPYWRLKVGDFRTEFDAETAADEIKRAFPQFAREVRIVRDRINNYNAK